MAMPQVAPGAAQDPTAATLEFKISVYADGSIGVTSDDGQAQKFGTIEDALKAVLQMYADESGAAGEEQEAYNQAAIPAGAAKAAAGAAKPAMMY